MSSDLIQTYKSLQVSDLNLTWSWTIWGLHSSRQVFLWVGREANECERKEAVVTSREYLHSHPGDRDPDTPIFLIKQGFEPPTFTGWFAAWDSTTWSVSPATGNPNWDKGSNWDKRLNWDEAHIQNSIFLIIPAVNSYSGLVLINKTTARAKCGSRVWPLTFRGSAALVTDQSGRVVVTGREELRGAEAGAGRRCLTCQCCCCSKLTHLSFHT